MPDTKIACPYCAADGTNVSYKSSVFFDHIFKTHEADVFSRRPFHRTDTRGQLHNLKQPFHIVLNTANAQTGDVEESLVKRYVCLGCHHAVLKSDNNLPKFIKHCDECPMYTTAVANLRDKYPLAITAKPEVKKDADIYEMARNNLQEGSGPMDSLNAQQHMIYRNLLLKNTELQLQAAEAHSQMSALLAERNKYKYLATQLFFQASVARAVSHEDPKFDDKLEKKKKEFQQKQFLNTLSNPQVDNYFIGDDAYFTRYRLYDITPEMLLTEFKRHKCTLFEVEEEQEQQEKLDP